MTAPPVANDLLAAALEYVSYGWQVFPIHSARGGACTCGKRDCKRPAKHPIGSLVPGGLKDASADPETIKKWWLAVPWANIGIATGGGSDLVVLDVDIAGDKIGEQSLEDLVDKFGALPDTVEQITGSGGRHIVFKHPGSVEIKNSISKIGKDLDIRGDGGYIIAPPSRHISGGRYEWEGSSEPAEVELAALPAWLIALTLKAAPSKQARPPAAPSKPLPDLEVSRIREALVFLDYDDRESWLMVGMALQATGAANAYDVWREWSQQSDKFDEADQLRVWASFRAGGTNLGTLFHHAKLAGYDPAAARRANDPPPAELCEGYKPLDQAPPGGAPQVGGGLGGGIQSIEARDGIRTYADGEVGPAPDGFDWKIQFIETRDGSIKANPGNVELVFKNDPAWSGVLAYCEFSNRIVKLKTPPYRAGLAGEWDDSDTAQARVWMAHKYKFCGSDSDTVAAALVAAKHNGRHPVRDYLEAVEWDGTERIAELFVDLEADGPAEYLRLVSVYWFIGAVKRIFEPGCKHDYMLVLEGRQGQGKSSWARVLGGEYFSDAPIPLGDKDAYQNIQGVWIQELAELASLNKADSYQAKQFVSQAVDRYRPSYGKFASKWPRQSVLIGTTNDRVWIKDPTGGRRYWPVLIPDDVQIDVVGIEAKRDQYWAEAVALYRQGVEAFPDRETEERLFIPEQEARMLGDSWEDVIRPWLDGGAGEWIEGGYRWIELIDVFTGPLNMTVAIVQKAHEMRVASILQRAGWKKERKRLKRPGENSAKQRYVYISPKEAADPDRPF